jgi:hypothetical protein
MLIEEQNKKGGLLGKKLEAVVVDPASNWPLFAEKARELISKENVAAVFGDSHVAGERMQNADLDRILSLRPVGERQGRQRRERGCDCRAKKESSHELNTTSDCFCERRQSPHRLTVLGWDHVAVNFGVIARAR